MQQNKTKEDLKITIKKQGLTTCKWNSCFSILCWNVRGLGSPRAFLALRKINLLYDRKQSDQVLNAIRSMERELESLLSKEELYWKQRSRVDWLLAGDKNSKFFHRRATARKKKNQISSLLDSRGVRRESEQGMSSVVLDYFSDLFRSI
ncbi:hypothetical protein ACOSQ3_005632 [Xanthoceras sorbifolium]